MTIGVSFVSIEFYSKYNSTKFNFKIYFQYIQNDDNDTIPVYKVWNLTKVTKNSGLLCLRTTKILLQKPTTLAVSDNGQYLAIGFDRGSISVYRGDICKDRSKTHKTLSAGISPITGIAFKQCGKIFQMFVCSDSGVLVYNLQNKDKEIKTTLDKTCEPTRCCALQTSSNDAHFMVGRDDVKIIIKNICNFKRLK